MVTARLAVGSVSTLALGALLLGSAPYWLNRAAGTSRGTPWGAISSLSGGNQVASASAEERASLLKLASLKTAPAAADPSPSIPDSAPAEMASTPAPAPETQAMDAASTQSPGPEAAASVAPPPAGDAQPAPQQVATAEQAPAPDLASDDTAAKPSRININTASSDTLDHLPGAGRIGHAIVSHRPYRSVKDLVSRRVLRTSDFQKIQSRISID